MLTRKQLEASTKSRPFAKTETLADGTQIRIKLIGTAEYLAYEMALADCAEVIDEVDTDGEKLAKLSDPAGYAFAQKTLVASAVLDGESKDLLYTGPDDPILDSIGLAAFRDQFRAVKRALGISKGDSEKK